MEQFNASVFYLEIYFSHFFPLPFFFLSVFGIYRTNLLLTPVTFWSLSFIASETGVRLSGQLLCVIRVNEILTLSQAGIRILDEWFLTLRFSVQKQGYIVAKTGNSRL
jgi:hypothetical protein